MYATDNEIVMIVEGKSTSQIIDVNPENTFKKGSIPKAVNIPCSTFFTSHHSMNESEKVTAAVLKAKIDMEKTIIFFGSPKMFAARVAGDTMGYKHVKVYEKSFADWKKDYENTEKALYGNAAKIEEKKTETITPKTEPKAAGNKDDKTKTDLKESDGDKPKQTEKKETDTLAEPIQN